MPANIQATHLVEQTDDGYILTFIQSNKLPSQLNYNALVQRKKNYNTDQEQRRFLKSEKAMHDARRRAAGHRTEVKRLRAQLKMKEHLLHRAEELQLAEAELLQKATLALANLAHPKPIELRDGRRFDVTITDNRIELRGRKPGPKRKKK